jgi:large subunit ribosomal protein L28
MGRTCDVCGKGGHVGGSITRRGLAKKKGGIGMHVVKNVKRTFSPNLQRIRVRSGSSVLRKLVCAACIRRNAVEKA